MIKIILICTVIFLLILLKSRYEVKHFIIKKYAIHSEKISESARICFISDLHNCTYGRNNRKLIDAIVSLQADALIIAGDMIVGKKDASTDKLKYYNNGAEFIKEISEILPTYYVFGNHETRLKELYRDNGIYDEYMEEISRSRVNIINNTSVKIKDNLVLTGLEIENGLYKEKNHKTVEENLSKLSEKGGLERQNYSILCTHTPEYFDDYAKAGFDLSLCGHNHGGTVRIPFIGGIISRDFKPFPKYSYGLYENEEMKMILTSGLGDHTIPFRLFNPPEIVVIEMERKSKIK